MKSDVPLLVHLGLLELDVGAVEPVPEAEPPVAGVKPVEDQTVVTLTSYSCTIHRCYVKAGGADLTKKRCHYWIILRLLRGSRMFPNYLTFTFRITCQHFLCQLVI